jgi:lysozyme
MHYHNQRFQKITSHSTSLLIMKLTLFVGATLIHSTVSAYSITGNGVNCRSGPGTSYDVKKMYAKGHDVSISCQASGPNIKGDAIWDKTSDGCYVADYYVKTGSSGYVVAKCSGGAEGSGGSGGGSGGCGAPSANAATVDLIAGFEGWVDHVCE